MRNFRAEECERAALRGFEFVHRFARRPRHFATWGSDFLNLFDFVARSPASPKLRRLGREAGRELARRWRRLHRSVRPDADAESVYDLLYGDLYARRLGEPDPALRGQLRRAVRRFTPRDYFGFDPTSEPPPRDLPAECLCGRWNERGRKTCQECRRRLRMQSRYGVWYVALIRTYMAARARLSLGAEFADVLGWLPSMRPYPPSDYADADFYDAAYAVTHVVYTLNDYDLYRLRPAWLPAEFAFVKANVREAMNAEDAEMTGEFLDTLKCFGLDARSALVREATDFLLARQNPDGSWGDTETENVYCNYHPTLTAASALAEIRWRGARLAFPEVKPLLARASKGGRGRT
jgi:hypothetical protein